MFNVKYAVKFILTAEMIGVLQRTKPLTVLMKQNFIRLMENYRRQTMLKKFAIKLLTKYFADSEVLKEASDAAIAIAIDQYFVDLHEKRELRYKAGEAVNAAFKCRQWDIENEISKYAMSGELLELIVRKLNALQLERKQ